MSLLNIAALAGAFFLAVPILIHLIHRQRYPRVGFSTLRFFERTRRHNVIQRRLVDVILLILRLGAIALLVLALARPLLGVGGAARTSVAIVLDNSASMSARVDGNRTAFDIARDRALAVLEALKPGDRAAVITSVPGVQRRYSPDKATLKADVRRLAGSKMVLHTRSGRGAVLSPTTDTAVLLAAIDELPNGEQAAVVPSQPPTPKLSADLAALKNQLSALQIAYKPGDLAPATTTAADLLATAGDARWHLFVFTDQPEQDDPPELSDRTILHRVSLGSAKLGNLAIEDVRPSQTEARLGEPLKMSVLVRNYAARASGPLEIAVEIPGEKPVVISEPSIGPGKARGVDVYVSTFTRENFVSGVVRIESANDAYTVDNSFYFTVPVRPTARVLCVNGVKAEAVADRDTFYLANALAPRSAGGSEQLASGIDVRTCDVDDLPDEILFQYDVTVLANVAALDEKMRERLAAYLRDGRSLLVFLGDRYDAVEYNAWGFLPGDLGQEQVGEFVVLDQVDFAHPALAPFADPAYGDLRGFGAFGHVAVIPNGDGERVLASFHNGQPALIEHRVGTGRIVLCTTSCHTAWSKWPLVPAFVPFAQRLVSYLATPGERPEEFRSYLPGQVLPAPVEESFRAGRCLAYRREFNGGPEKLVPVALDRRTDGGVARALETDNPGNYLVVEHPAGQQPEVGKIALGARVYGFSVNVDRSESLIPARNSAAGPETEIQEMERGGSELWWPLLLVMACLLVAESLVAWRTNSQT